MNVKKFSANTSREALALLRDTLGPDAVILSNRKVNGMVEILALAAEDMTSLPASTMKKEGLADTVLAAFSSRRRVDAAPATVAPAATVASAAPSAAPPTPVPTATTPALVKDQASGLTEAMTAPRNPVAPASAADHDIADLMGEIRSMRGMLETQLAELSWNNQQQREPMKAAVMRELLAAGFSASLSRYLSENLPATEKVRGGMRWVESTLTRNLNTMKNESEMLEKGGVFALVGPTGVGKTTTTAKLAARCVMRHGASKLALITTDGYRIGGYEQLRIYGKIMGVMVHSVKDEADLRIALDELKNKHTVLIDTVGVSQRDRMVAEQVAMLSGAGTPVKRLLCLSATSNGETLNEVVRAYRGNGLAGCIITKLDEAATIGSVLDVIIRQKLNLHYLANGQRVPEDLHLANGQYLIDRAFKLKRETAAFRFQDNDLPMVAANAARMMNDKGLREVVLG